MTYNISFEDYVNEIELVAKQFPYECDLYFLITYLLRGCSWNNRYVIRNISDGRKSLKVHSDLFMSVVEGESEKELLGFPDLAIVPLEFDKNISAKKDVNAVVEIKTINNKLKVTNQLVCQINTFSKVIYTNGLKWKFYCKTSDHQERMTTFEIELGTCDQNWEITWNLNARDKWCILLKTLEEFI